MDWRDIFQSSKVLEFWPSAGQTADERMHSTARFVIYATTLSYLISRDTRIFVLGIMVLSILYYISLTSDGGNSITMPTIDNIMGNVLMSDYSTNPGRPSAAWSSSVNTQIQQLWAKIHPFENVRDAQSRFVSTPSTTITNDQNAFAEASYGKKFSPFCKDGSGTCNVDESWNSRFHFPEVTQMRGGNGGGYGKPPGS